MKTVAEFLDPHEGVNRVRAQPVREVHELFRRATIDMPESLVAADRKLRAESRRVASLPQFALLDLEGHAKRLRVNPSLMPKQERFDLSGAGVHRI